MEAADESARELARLLNAQADVCRSILEKSKLQQKLVEEAKEDELLTLLNDKQRLMDKHQSLVVQATPHRQRWETGGREQAGPESHAAVENAYNELRNILDSIVKLEDASRALLEEQKGKVSGEINRIQRGKMMNKAYGGGKIPPPVNPRYSDKQG